MRRPSVRVRAEFELDSEGNPVFIEGGPVRHYRIRLFVDDAPDAAESVTYELHESYYNPLREVFRSDGGDTFEHSITSYGDFEIVTTISGSADAGVAVRTNLAEALGEWSREQQPSSPRAADAIRQALEAIEEH